MVRELHTLVVRGREQGANVATILTVSSQSSPGRKRSPGLLHPHCGRERLVAKVPLGRVHVSPAGRSLAKADCGPARSHALPGRPGAL